MAIMFPAGNTNIKNLKPSQPQEIVCRPKSTCDVCKPKSEPVDTFTPSNSQPMAMADPTKYPNHKNAENGRLGSSIDIRH